MFKYIFIATAVFPAIRSKDLPDFDQNIGFPQRITETNKENPIKCNVNEEVAILREMVLKQGQEISGLKQQQEEKITGLKQEIFLLKDKANEQNMLIDSQVKLITKLENIVQNQDKQANSENLCPPP